MDCYVELRLQLMKLLRSVRRNQSDVNTLENWSRYNHANRVLHQRDRAARWLMDELESSAEA